MLPENHITHIIKRNGEVVSFDQGKITNAIYRATQAVGKTDTHKASDISDTVVIKLNESYNASHPPRIEDIQDIVEKTLMEGGLYDVAKAYIIYRYDRTKIREANEKNIDFSKPVSNKIQTIIKRNGMFVPFDQEKITVAIYKAAASLGIHNRPLAEKLSNEVVWILNQKSSLKKEPTVEEIQDVVEDTLIRNAKTDIARVYIIYRHERSKVRGATKEGKEIKEDYYPYKKIWNVLSWNTDHHCARVEDMNELIRSGKFVELVNAGDKAYEDDVSRAAEEIIKQKGKVRIVIIAGPSSSGKTTTTIKVNEKLNAHGFDLVALNIDNYFYDLELHPKDEFGDYDFETPEALDLPLIKQHLADLVNGKKVEIPRYNFKTGHREKETDSFQIDSHQVILIDTLHGLYKDMTSSVPDDIKFKLYIETLNQLKMPDGNFVKWADMRLLRRMARDRIYRAYNPKQTIEHWHYVRRSEMKHIIPYIHTVDYIVNGALPYELPIMKKYLCSYFPDFVKEYEKDEKHQDAYKRAKRILDLFTSLDTVEDDSCIAKNSLLREFIGGSCYKY